MSEIEDEAYSEAMDEIAHLNQLNDDLIADKKHITEVARKAITDRDAEIDQLKAANTDLQRECMGRGVRIADLERLLVRAATLRI